MDRHGTKSLSLLTEKGKVDFMKKTIMIFLSVTMALAVAGCNGRQGRGSGVTGELAGNRIPVEAMETALVLEPEAEEPTLEPKAEPPAVAQEVDVGQEEGHQRKDGLSLEGQPQEGKQGEEAEGTPEAAETDPADVPAQSGQGPGSQEDGAGSVEENTAGDSSGSAVENTAGGSSGNAAMETASLAYSPQEVVSLATAKVKAGGKLILSEELDRKLSEGAITQEEYQEYYPYDGTGYYSVFVETDLNRACTTSGRPLGSVDGIAQYIADLLLLETVPSVEIEYAGVYTSKGSQFYEFRCHR